MPNRRVMELAVVVVVLAHPVMGMVRLWSAKHLATSDRPWSRTAAAVAARLF